MNTYQEETSKREEWVSTLKVGDVVAFRGSHWNSRNWYISEIVKITPTGRLNLKNLNVIMPDGSIRGDSYGHIYPVTDEIRKSIWRRVTISRLNNGLKIENLSDKHLKEVYNIFSQHNSTKYMDSKIDINQ